MRVSLLPLSLGVALLGSACLSYACGNNTLPGFANGGPSVGTDAAVADAPLPSSTKGYELYAWSAEGTLHFTLITGTNRAKTLAEVMVDDASVDEGDFIVVSGQGTSALERLLKRVPADTAIVQSTLAGLPALGAEFAEVVERQVAAHSALGNASDAGSAEPDSDKLRACPSLVGSDTGSAGACTEIGCSDGFTLATLWPGAWTRGAYRFVFTLDGRSIQCTGTLPLAPCGTTSVQCDAAGVAIGESGCALDASQQGLGDVRIDGFPASVHVELFRDDVSIVVQDITPDYRASQPNGPGCAPACCNAQAELDW